MIDDGKTLVESLEAAARTSDKLKEIWEYANGIVKAYATSDVTKYLDAVRGGLAVFGCIGDFYGCLHELESRTSGGSIQKAPVRILTYQSSKGLEADCVFIIGLEDNTIPSDIGDGQKTAEEARIMFVAMTRAKKELHLTHVRKRTGASTYHSQSHQLGPSAFVQILPRGQVSSEYVAAEGSKKKRSK